MPDVSQLQVSIGVDTSGLDRGLAEANAKVGGFGSSFGGIASAAATAFAVAGGAMAAGLAVGVKAAGDLQQSVANISTIKPQIDTSQVFDALNQMSTRIPQTASQLGDSLYNVFSSMNVGAEEGLALVEQFAQGAVGAGTSAETFGTAAMGVMNAYGLSAADASHVSDIFFNTIRDGVVTGQELASSLGPVTQSAKAAGVGLEELGAMIVGVTKEGGPAAQNINNLNNLLQKITTKGAQTEIQALGVATTTATGAFRPTLDVLGDLKASLAGMTESARANALQAIFPDAQARIGAMTVMSQLDAVNEALAANQTQVGSAASAYQTMSATFNSQSQLLMNSLLAVGTTIGAQVLPMITPLIKTFAEGLPGAFAAAQAALGPTLSEIARQVGDAFRTIQQVFAGDWVPSAEVDAFVNVVGILATAARETLRVIQQIFAGDLPTAFGTFVAGVQTLGAQLGPILAGWGQAFTAWVAPMIPPMLAALGTLLASLGTWIVGTALPALTAQLLVWGQAFIAWVTPMIPPVLAALGSLLAALGTWITGTALPAIAAQLLIWGQAFVAWVAPMIPLVVTALGGLLTAISTWVTGTALPAIGMALMGWGTAFLDWLTPVVAGIPASLAALATAITDWLVATAAAFPAQFVAWVTAFSAWVPLAATAMTTELTTLRTTMLAWIQGESPPLIATGLAAWTLEIAKWVPIAITQMMAALPLLLVQMTTWIVTTAAPEIVTSLGAWSKAFVGWVAPTIPLLAAELPKLEIAIVKACGEIAANVVVSAGAIGVAIVRGIIAGIESAAPNIVTAIGRAVNNGIRNATGGGGGGGQPGDMPRLSLLNKDAGGDGRGSPTATREEVDAVIRQVFAAFGHDPNIGIRVSHSEGGAGSVGDHGTSFGPFQLHRGGLADPFQRDTGLDPSDPSTWPAQIKWVAQNLPQTGWGPWSGARNQGITGQTGISVNPPQAMPDTSGFTDVTQQAADLCAATTHAAECVTTAVATATPAWTGMTAALDASTTQMAQGILVNAVQFKDGFSTITKDLAGNAISTFTDMNGQVVGQTVTMASGTQVSLETMAALGQVTVQNMGSVIVTTMTDMAGNVTTTTTDLSGHVIDQATVMGVGVGAASTAMWTDVTAQTTAGTALFTTGIAGMANQAIVDGQTMGAGVGAANEIMWTDVSATTVAGSAGVTEQFKGMADAALITVVALNDGTTATFTQMGADTIETITDMSGNVVGVVDLMNTDSQTAAQQMQEFITEQARLMQENAAASVEDMATAIGDQMTDVTTSFKDIVKPISDFQGALDSIEPPDLGDVVDELDKVTKAAQKAAAAIKKVGGSDSDDGKGHGGHIGGGGGDSAGDVGPSSFGSEMVAPSSATKGDIVINIALNGANLSSSREMQDAVIVALESASARGRY